MASLVVALVGAVAGCGSDSGDSATSETDIESEAPSTTPTTRPRDETGTPVELNLFGTTLTVDEVVERRSDSAGPFVEVALTLDNSESSFPYDLDVALVCTNNANVGRYLSGVESTLSGELMDDTVTVAKGDTDTYVALLTRPLTKDEVFIEGCDGLAAVASLGREGSTTIRLGDETTQFLFG